ncbi:MAG: shikimate kinase [Candidatus Paceibacteria bacterium]|jgi:shikimate kinase
MGTSGRRVVSEKIPSLDLPLALVGLRGTGKTSLGHLLAERLSLPFLDLDLELARRFGEQEESTGALLQRVGLQRFRELESEALATCLAPAAPFVLATGGGVIESPANRDLLGRAARCVWLLASPQVLMRRMAGDPSFRPPLTDLSPLAECEELARRRAPLYEEVSELALETGDRGLEFLADEIFCHLSR